jgi:1-pyrroline-5-carboxylate dehydrogenase
LTSECSATSRLFVPEDLWPAMRERLVEEVSKIRMGQPEAMDAFVTAVIDSAAFDKITGSAGTPPPDVRRFIKAGKVAAQTKLVCGGGFSNKTGYFIEPTVFETLDPSSPLLKDEIFGPVLTVFPYDPKRRAEALQLCAAQSRYALTGAIFGEDEVGGGGG